MRLSPDERFLIGAIALAVVAGFSGLTCPAPFGPFIAAAIVAAGNWVQFTFRRL